EAALPGPVLSGVDQPPARAGPATLPERGRAPFRSVYRARRRAPPRSTASNRESGAVVFPSNILDKYAIYPHRLGHRYSPGVPLGSTVDARPENDTYPRYRERHQGRSAPAPGETSYRWRKETPFDSRPSRS